MKKWTEEELTCPECGFVAKDRRGWNGHRQFKHGISASSTQMPKQEQDLLVTESKLDERLEPIPRAIGLPDNEQLIDLKATILQLTNKVNEVANANAANEKSHAHKTFDELMGCPGCSEWVKTTGKQYELVAAPAELVPAQGNPDHEEEEYFEFGALSPSKRKKKSPGNPEPKEDNPGSKPLFGSIFKQS